MKVKQTARKSTAHSSSAPYHGPSTSGTFRPSALGLSTPDPRSAGMATARRNRTHVMNDPIVIGLQRKLETKRKSNTPQHKLSPAYGQGKGQKILNHSIKTPPRNRPGEVALNEIKKLQHATNNLIPRAPFHRLVREITHGLVGNQDGEIRFQTAALEALQDATEGYLVQLFEDSYLCCLHAKRVTLFKQDIQLCLRLQQHGRTR